MQQATTSEVVTVSQYLDKINLVLKNEKAKIVGEVSGIQEYPGRSYLYFSIKDSKDQSTIRCFMWKRDYTLSGVTLKEGLEVIVGACPAIYKPNGGISLQVEVIELVGEGALQIAYEKLKKKLELEGLFSIDRKRELSLYPHKIGVVTSKSGAVINDFLTNIGKFGFQILFVDSKVEGQDAIFDLLSAVKTLKTKDIDVLVIMRGGGSLESFQAFNNEVLVREVCNFPVPVLTGIGHEKDAPLVSMVSDKNVSTPTAVANLLNSSWNEAKSKVHIAEQKIISEYESNLKEKQFFVENSSNIIENKFRRFLETFRRAEETVFLALGKISAGIKSKKEEILSQLKDLNRNFSFLISETQNSLIQSEKTIELSSPVTQLKRGYSIVKIGRKVVKSVKNTKKGDRLDITLSDGNIETQII